MTVQVGCYFELHRFYILKRGGGYHAGTVLLITDENCTKNWPEKACVYGIFGPVFYL